MIKLPKAKGYSSRIMTSPTFWVKTTNELVHDMKKYFPNRVEVKISSLDKPLIQ